MCMQPHHARGKEWSIAADLCLWCLQPNASRRPHNMKDVLQHRFFNSDGQLHYFESVQDTVDGFVRQQAKELTASINASNSDAS